jgi:hypothetical protein
VRKPDPTGLVECFRRLGADCGLYVGDSEVDAETAARAGLPFALFTQGYRRGPAEAMRASFAFDDFARPAAPRAQPRLVERDPHRAVRLRGLGPDGHACDPGRRSAVQACHDPKGPVAVVGG